MRSTRTTSAPRSARSIAAKGAGPTPASSTTRTPASGPCPGSVAALASLSSAGTRPPYGGSSSRRPLSRRQGRGGRGVGGGGRGRRPDPPRAVPQLAGRGPVLRTLRRHLGQPAAPRGGAPRGHARRPREPGDGRLPAGTAVLALARQALDEDDA